MMHYRLQAHINPRARNPAPRTPSPSWSAGVARPAAWSRLGGVGGTASNKKATKYAVHYMLHGICYMLYSVVYIMYTCIVAPTWETEDKKKAAKMYTRARPCVVEQMPVYDHAVRGPGRAQDFEKPSGPLGAEGPFAMPT